MNKIVIFTKPTAITALSLFFFLAGVATLVPNPAGTKASVLGYKAICPFSPFSTILLFYLANLLRGIVKSKKQIQQ